MNKNSLKEIKKYDNNKLIKHYFIDEFGLLQGIYRTYYSNGFKRYESFEQNSLSVGVAKKMNANKNFMFLFTWKLDINNGIDIEFFYF